MCSKALLKKSSPPLTQGQKSQRSGPLPCRYFPARRQVLDLQSSGPGRLLPLALALRLLCHLGHHFRSTSYNILQISLGAYSNSLWKPPRDEESCPYALQLLFWFKLTATL